MLYNECVEELKHNASQKPIPSQQLETFTEEQQEAPRPVGEEDHPEKQQNLPDAVEVSGKEESKDEIEKKEEAPEEMSIRIHKSLLQWLNKGDLVTGFTGLHFAFFVEDIRLIHNLILKGAAVDKKDNFFAT